MSKKIVSEVRIVKENYDKTINIVSGLYFKQKDVIRMIEFYSSSKYLGSQKDEHGHEKPFFQILNGMCDIENAAKDLDTKDVSVTCDDGNHYIESFLMTRDIYEWMKTVAFGVTLNNMRDEHTRYGSLLVKKCTETKTDPATGKQTKMLTIELPEWKNLITDQVNILGGPIIEVHFMTPSDILKKRGIWDKKGVDAVMEKAEKAPGKRIPVYEVRGEFPKSYFKELDQQGYQPTKKDQRAFSYQLYYFAGEIPNQTNDENIAVSNFSEKLIPLYWEDDTERVYKYLARKKKAGRSFGVGIFEEGEEAQVWTNDIVIKQKRAMDFTTKSILQTASKKLKGRNTLTEVEDGAILEHEDNKPITAVPLLPSGGLTQYPAIIQQWFAQLERVTSAYAMQRGEVTTKNFRLQSLALQQSSAVFKDLQEELGLFVQEIFQDWIMPYLAKQLNAEHILAHEYTPDELKEIDDSFATSAANQAAIQKFLSGKVMTAEQYAQERSNALSRIQQTKGQRFLKIPKDYYKNFNAKVTVSVTDEARQNKALTLEALMQIMNIYVKNPQLATDPVLTQIFIKIVEISGAGISPIALVSAMQQQAKLQAEAAKNGSTGKVSESMNFKDLPPEGQQQMAKQAGIDITPPDPNQGADVTATADSGGNPGERPSFSLTASGGQQ